MFLSYLDTIVFTRKYIAYKNYTSIHFFQTIKVKLVFDQDNFFKHISLNLTIPKPNKIYLT